MKLRVFGSTTCERCELIRNGLVLLGRTFEFIDAMADDNDAICDLHEVDLLPHVQILDDNNEVVWQKADRVSLTTIISQLKNLEQNETQ